MADINLIRDITNAFGPSGFEEEVCRVIKNYTEGFDVTNDAMCNVYMKRKDFGQITAQRSDKQCSDNKMDSGVTRKPVLMLDAHSDECGMMIQGIRENGLLNSSRSCVLSMLLPKSSVPSRYLIVLIITSLKK